MGVNDGFVEQVMCPRCGEGLLRVLQTECDDVWTNDYYPGDSVSTKVLASVKTSEREFIQALESDLGVLDLGISTMELESEEGDFNMVGRAYLIAEKCSCGKAEPSISSAAVVSKKVFVGLSPEPSSSGPLVTSHGLVFPRWILNNDSLRPIVEHLLQSTF